MNSIFLIYGVFKRLIMIIMFAGIGFFSIEKSYSQTLDQSQLVYNGGMSARTLAGYNEWQSFTAGMTGTLCQIKMGFFNYINGVGTLKIFSGTGTAGLLLQTKAVTVFNASGSNMITFLVSVSITAGQVYTFQFIPGAGIPDPYGVQVAVPGPYNGGYMGLVDPSGTYNPGFDLVFQTYIGSPLPVNLISFTGINLNSHNILNWVTATEILNSKFEIERSTNGIDFKKIGEVAGNFNTSSITKYTYADYEPMSGINYYRLKQIDINGEFSYSTIVSLKSIVNSGINIFPNPCIYQFCISLNEEALIFGANANAVILDNRGSIFKTINLTSTKNTINTSDWPAGIYLVQIGYDEARQTFRLLKQ